MLYEKILMGFDFEFVLSPQKRISSEPIQIDGSKVLDFRDPKTRDFFNERLDISNLLLNRSDNSSYNLPNMLGHSARSNQVESVILQSIPDKKFGSGYNFHSVGNYGN